MDIWVLLFDGVILLAGALLLGGIFSRFGQSPLVGFILAGMLLGGPGSFRIVRSEEDIGAIADLGVALLLFSLGLEFSVARLRAFGGRALLGGTLQVIITALLGAVAGRLFGLPISEAIAVGAMISLSSTAVVLRLLVERADVDSAHGRNSIGVLLAQDIAVVPLALLMTLLGTGGSAAEVGSEIARILVLAALLILALYLVLNRIAVLALGTLTFQRNRELTVILATVTGLGSAWAAHAAGISPALGAFVAGMFLGSSPFATQIRADVSSLGTVLLTLFFGAAGMVANPVWIIQNWYLVLGVTTILLVAKMLVMCGIFRVLGQSTAVAAASAICLAQIGEFAFVLGAIGQDNGVLSEDTYVLIVSVAIVSLLLSPYLVPAAPKLAARLTAVLPSRKATPSAGVTQDVFAPDVVIIGFGPAGQVAAQPFVERSTRVLVIDLNRHGVNKGRELGFAGLVGDATLLSVLEHANLVSAKAVVITIPHYRSAMAVLEHVRRLAPAAHVVVRSRYQLHSGEFAAAGADMVVGDEEETGEALGRRLQEWLASVEELPTHESMARRRTAPLDDPSHSGDTN